MPSPDPVRLLSRQSVSPQQLEPGDRFKMKRGPYAGLTVEFVSRQAGRYGTFNLKVRIVDPVQLGVDYNELLEVDRAAS